MVYMEKFAYRDVKTDTGFEVATIQHIWDKYNSWLGSPRGTFGNQVPQRKRDPDKTGFYFYLVYVYMHKCPQLNWTETFRSGDGKHVAGRRAFINNVFPIAEALANILDEVDYARRLDPYNHGLPPFDKSFTILVDTLPIYIPAPHDWYLSTLFYQPKYKACVVKMQLGINFKGEIVLWTGPHLGVESDVGIWNSTWAEHPFRPWERGLADLGYVGAIGLVTKYKKPTGGVLTGPQVIFSNVHEHTRNRIEQIVSVVKDHRMFKHGCYKGSLKHLEYFLDITGHTTACELNQFQRFDTYGPWPH